MKLLLCITAILCISFKTLDPLEVEYIFLGSVYYNGKLLKNTSIDYYEFPSAAYKKTFLSDINGRYKCEIITSGPCPWFHYGSGTSIQKVRLLNYIDRMNSDSIVFHFKNSIVKLKNMADSVQYNFILKEGDSTTHNLTFQRDIYFTGS